MGDRRCCCSTDCLILEDDFERADNDDIGPLWNEVDLEWAIVSGDLVPSELPAMVITTKRNTRSRRGVLQGEFTLTGSGPWSVSFLLNAKADGSFYQQVDFSCTETEATVSAGLSRTFNTVTGGGKKPSPWVWNGAADKRFYFSACLTDGLIHLWISGQDLVYNEDYLGTISFSGCAWDIHTDPSTSGQGYAGILHTAGDIKFHWVKYYQHYNDDPECPECMCVCSESPHVYSPMRITVDITNGSGCPDVDGASLVFEPVACDADGGAEMYCCVSGSIAGVDQSWEEWGWQPPACARMDCGTYALALIIGCGWDYKAPVSVECDPFVVSWTHTAPPEGCGICGASGMFDVVATETA